MSLELGRSSAATDDNDEPTDVGNEPDVDEQADVGEEAADGAAGDAAGDAPARRRVLAPFMAGSANDSQQPDDASGDTAGDAVRQGDAPRGDDTGSLATPGAGTSAPVMGPDEPAASDDESDAGDTAASSDPPGGDPGDPGTSGVGASPPLASGTAATASDVPRPRFIPTAPPHSSPGPRTDSVGLGQASADADGPLLGDAEELRANWLRLQAGFVDDPGEAVSDAADLVEHAAQALVGAMRVRQQQLREMWDGGRQKAGSGRADTRESEQGAEPTGAAADSTEQLRLLMKRYRLLFNQICRS